MKGYPALAFLSILIAGCAGYKELQPDPEITPVERGYIELSKGKDRFELQQGKKYYMKFPAPQADHFDLVLVTPSKRAISRSFTSTFDNGAGAPIPDESASDDSVSVYAIDRSAPTFFWVIDTVRADAPLALRYRYVPVWRYTFENKYSEFQDILSKNRVSRTTYNAISLDFDIDGLDVGHELPIVSGATAKLEPMRDELQRLASVFPSDIASSRDTAYQEYLELKAKVDDELAFQGNYATILTLFRTERETRGNTPMFLDSIPYFSGIMKQRDRFPATVITKASQVLLGRLAQVQPFLDNLVRVKSDITPIAPVPNVETLGELYTACGDRIPRETEAVIQFINRFNEEGSAIPKIAAKFDALRTFFDSQIGSPPESFYADLAGKIAEIKSSIPEPLAGKFPRYGSYNCAALLLTELTNTSGRAEDLRGMYEAAGGVSAELRARSWAPAEAGLRELNDAHGGSGSSYVAEQRAALVRLLETGLFSAVKSESEQRVNAFIGSHQMAIENVPELYADSAFRPVHQLTFSSAGAADLADKRKQIESYLDEIKYIRFPETSIKSIYGDFTRNMGTRGVEKARAIVEHGKFYKGTDKQVKGLITECDVQAAKWIVKPKEYRKLFALPTTSDEQGVNEYMFRVQLKIPSDAEFPVFDVNLKLPQEIAGKSGTEKWYESITIDKKPIKNEGRFRITAPTAESNYEALITPVQMDKEGRNILEVRFKAQGFRVFEVSAMAQVPLIRKN